MGRRVVVSPHLGDAVASAWSALDGDALVVTVFAGVPPADVVVPGAGGNGSAESAAEVMLRRREEHARALAAVRTAHVELDFLESRFREAGVAHSAIVGVLHGLVAEADEVWVPAGVGGDPDHVATARAALDVARGRRTRMYAELPEALREWRPAPDAVDDEARLDAVLRTAPLAPPELPRIVELSDVQAAAKRAALEGCRVEGVAPRHEWVWDVASDLPAGRPLDLLPRALPPPGQDGDGPFLSVLMRTLGTRPEPFAQALESLARQRCRDFELLLLVHGAGPEALADVAAAVERLPAWLRAATRVEPVTGGGPARPLNHGLGLATGRYVAVLDDDDLALPDWVETFRELAARSHGEVLRAGVLLSDLREPERSFVFPLDFDLVMHVAVGNQTPCCGLAFPLRLLRGLDLRFDESLDIVYDWDFLLSVAPLAGVAVSPAVTSHYRRWGLADHPAAVHDTAAWRQAERRVTDRADRRPLLLPPGSVRVLREQQSELDALRRAVAEARELYESARRLYESERELRESERARRRELAASVEVFERSRSWRLTAPLRALSALARRLRRRDDVDARGEVARP